MKEKKKKSKIIIICFIIILILIPASLATLYYTTDMFKSDKVLFYKYASKININSITDTNFYLEQSSKMQNSKTIRNGEASFKAKNSIMDEEYFKIKYNSSSDTQNSLSQSNVKLISGNDEIISLNVLNNDNLYGIMIDDILNGYIVLENSNLKEFAEKLDMESEDIPDEINFDSYSNSINRTEEEKEALLNLKTKYVNMISEQISDENYSKLEKANIMIDGVETEVVGYKLTLSGAEIKTIAEKLIQSFKDDKRVFDEIVKVYPDKGLTYDEYKLQMDNILEEFNSEEMNNEEFLKSECMVVTIYQKDEETVKADFQFTYNTTTINFVSEYFENKVKLNINITKSGEYFSGESYIEETVIDIVNTQNSNGVDVNMEMESFIDGEEESKTILNMSRVGDISSDNVTHKININVNYGESEFEITLNDEVEFVSQTNIEEFKDMNHMILNDMQSDELQSLFSEISGAIINQLKERSDNPLGKIYMMFLGSNSSIITNQAEDTMDQSKIFQIQKEIMLAYSNAYNIRYSNGNFENTDITKEEVADILRESNVIADEEYFELKEKGYITVEDTKIDFNGKIIEDEINEDIDNRIDEMQKSTFNDTLLAYEGSQPGSNVKTLVTKISSSNSFNENQVNVILSGINYDPIEARELIEARHMYKVSFDYENGFIVNANIEY